MDEVKLHGLITVLECRNSVILYQRVSRGLSDFETTGSEGEEKWTLYVAYGSVFVMAQEMFQQRGMSSAASPMVVKQLKRGRIDHLSTFRAFCLHKRNGMTKVSGDGKRPHQNGLEDKRDASAKAPKSLSRVSVNHTLNSKLDIISGAD